MKKVTRRRAMDIHLLTRIEDDGSPFGVEYSTRRLTLEASGAVTCDDPTDALWQELTAGIPVVRSKGGAVVTPQDGTRFLDRVPCFIRYDYLSPLTPLVYDHRGSWRPDDFRITWKPSTRLHWGHGYVFMCERAGERSSDEREEPIPVAMLEGWGFYHDVERLASDAASPGHSTLRVVTVSLLPQRSSVWKQTVLGTRAGPTETKALVRSFLRRFFERCTIGVSLESEGRWGPFSWRGGF